MNEGVILPADSGAAIGSSDTPSPAPGPQGSARRGSFLRGPLVLLRPLVGLFRYARRCPGRFLILLVIVGLIGFGTWLTGLQLYGLYHLRQARESLNRYHNQEAQRHLEVCLGLRPND